MTAEQPAQPAPLTVSSPRHAAALLVGDELLSGRVGDENLQVLAATLKTCGVPLRRVVVVGDDVAEIGEALVWLRERFDLVVTSGGVGPTHDDVTMEAVASALRRPLESSDELRLRLATSSYPPPHDICERLALLPAGSELRLDPNTQKGWPTVVVDNVWVLPGIPAVFADKMRTLAAHICGSSHPATLELRVEVDEWAVKATLDQVVAAFPEVHIGSYPQGPHGEAATLLVLECFDSERLAAAQASLRAQLAALGFATTG